MKQLSQTAIILIIAALVVGFLVGWAVGKQSTKATPSKMTATSTPTTMATGTNKNTFTVTADKTAMGVQQNAQGMEGTRGTPDLVAQGTGSVSVGSQKAGATVLVSAVTLEKTGWVAVREDDNGSLGWILGAQRLPAGSHKDIAVQLLRSTAAGKKYSAVLYSDNGDGAFAKASDILLVKNGEPIASSFTAQ